MRRGAGWIVGLGAATLLLAAWVTTGTYVAPLRGAKDAANSGNTDRSNVPHPPSQGSGPNNGLRDSHLPAVLDVLFNVLLILFALLLIYVFVRAQLRRRRARSAAASATALDDAEMDGFDDTLPEGLARTADEGLARLAEGDPRNAIVRCWMMLEDTVFAAGLTRDPALTSEEFIARVLSQYAVRQAVIDELGRLYREARFSEHELDERHRTRAVTALNGLRDDLDAATRSSETASTGPTQGPR